MIQLSKTICQFQIPFSKCIQLFQSYNPLSYTTQRASTLKPILHWSFLKVKVAKKTLNNNLIKYWKTRIADRNIEKKLSLYNEPHFQEVNT